MTMRIIMWTLKLLDTEHSTAKALQAGAKLDLQVGWAQQGQLSALINQCLIVILEYIDLFNFYYQGTASFCLDLLLAMLLKQRNYTYFQDFRSLLV